MSFPGRKIVGVNLLRGTASRKKKKLKRVAKIEEITTI